MSEAFVYGDSPPFPISRFFFEDGRLKNDEIILERPEAKEDDYQRALEDINRTWGQKRGRIVDPKTANTFEFAMANSDASLDEGVDVEMSTYTSSISGNPGNAVELAESAALNPRRRRLYIASFGNGQSAYWSAGERRYIRSTGRFIQPDGGPLPLVASLERALRAADFIMTRSFSTNSMGGPYATALMGAMPEGQITHAYLKNRPNICSHNPAVLGTGMLIGDFLDDLRYKKTSTDPWRLTTERIDEAKRKLPNIYSEEAQNRHQTFTQKAGSSHKLSKMATDLIALSRGGYKHSYPAEHDTMVALERQPDAKVTFHFNAQDRLYNELPQDAENFLMTIVSLGKQALKQQFQSQLEALITPGKHRDHTQYPGLRWAAQNYAFNR